jgi:putative transposase
MRHISHKIRIYPNNATITKLVMCFGVARFAYNWGLQHCKQVHEEGGSCPSGYALSKSLNAIKKAEFPWMYEVSKWIPQMSLYNLASAFQNFFKKRSRFPRFKKRGRCRDSFYIGLGFKAEGNIIHIPSIGWIRMSQSLRFPGRPLSVVVSRSAGKYFASIQVELSDDHVYSHTCKSQASVGIDLGVKDLVVLSTGEKFENLRVLRFHEQKLRRVQKAFSRKRKGSRNRAKARGLLAKCHEKIRNIRSNNLHSLTSYLVENFRFIGVEDLNVSGMLKNHKLSKSIADASFFEIKRQLSYKSKLAGSEVVEIDRFFPSTKLCYACGFKLDSLDLSVRKWECPQCGRGHDRDVNAAINILNEAARGHLEAENACGEGIRRGGRKAVSRSSTKQEGGVSC